jgi:hypothetical protein
VLGYAQRVIASHDAVMRSNPTPLRASAITRNYFDAFATFARCGEHLNLVASGLISLSIICALCAA